MPEEEKQPCKGDHYIDGISPTLLDIKYDGRTCDCSAVRYVAEECGCPAGEKHLELKKYPNE